MADRSGRTRSTRTIEALSDTPDGAPWASREAPCLHDGPPADVGRPAIVRFLQFEPGTAPRQFGYPVDPIGHRQPNRWVDNGVSGILGLRQDRLLVLKRSGEQQANGSLSFHCRLCLPDFRDARDVTARGLHAGMAGIATKRLLIDFDRWMPKGSGNFDAIGWWPGHRGRGLLMANGNNFADAAARRLMLAALPEDPALR
jgi:hypothetical protein